MSNKGSLRNFKNEQPHFLFGSPVIIRLTLYRYKFQCRKGSFANLGSLPYLNSANPVYYIPEFLNKSAYRDLEAKANVKLGALRTFRISQLQFLFGSPVILRLTWYRYKSQYQTWSFAKLLSFARFNFNNLGLFSGTLFIFLYRYTETKCECRIRGLYETSKSHHPVFFFAEVRLFSV